MTSTAHRILWIDGGAGFVVGLAILVLREWLAALWQFPIALVVTIGVGNLTYAAYSGSLAFRASQGHIPSRFAVDALIVGNLVWGCVCLVFIATMWNTGTFFGLGQAFIECMVVVFLALFELRLVRPHAR